MASTGDEAGRWLCVFCGSRLGLDGTLADVTADLGRAMVRRGYGLVYGGGRAGLMGVLADSVLEAGGKVIGVVPHILKREENAHPGLLRNEFVDSLAERKLRMEELCDGFVVLPGGVGTYDELFEFMAWSALRLTSKSLGILNTGGFYNQLAGFLDHASGQGFVAPERLKVFWDDSVESLLSRFDALLSPER